MFPKREICIALLLSIAIISPVSARFSDGFKTNDCSDAPIQHQAFTRAIQSLCSLDNEDVMYLVQLARSTHKSARENLYQSLEYRLKPAGSFDVQDFAEIWVTISKLNLPINNVRDHMASLASGHVNLANSLHQSPVLHTGIQASREQAAAVLKNQPPDVYLARGTLSNALETLLNELSSLPAGDQLRELKFAPVIAQLFRDLAWLEESELNIVTAAKLHEAAAHALPEEKNAERLDDLSKAALLWRSQGEISGQIDEFEESIRVYEEIHDLVSHQQAPVQWAMVQNGLGLSLQMIGLQTNDIERLEQSADAFRASLEIMKENDNPIQFALVQNNLGLTLQTIGDQKANAQNLEGALAAFDQALKGIDREQMPLIWANVHNNRGRALLSLARRKNDIQLLGGAIDTFHEALTVWNRKHSPYKWAMIHNNLGTALQEIGTRGDSAAMLEKAEETFSLALEEYTHEHTPLSWAATQHNLGLVLWHLGDKEDDVQFLEEANTAFRSTLKEFTQNDSPLEWASTQHNLGLVAKSLAEKKQSTKHMDEAVSAFRSALEFRGRDHAPLDRATTQDQLGKAHLFLGVKHGDVAHLQKALYSLEEAYSIRVVEAKMERFKSGYLDQMEAIETLISDFSSNY